MSEVEEQILEDIIVIIKDNLKLLIQNNNNSLYYVKQYCNELSINDFPILQRDITILTEQCLYALLNADFLYDFRNVE